MKPGLLLVEDDPTSAAYLAAALEPLGTAVTIAATTGDACDAVARETHCLWLIDAHLPDGSGMALLGRLHARRPGVRAIAHTASPAADLHRRLRGAGFAEVVVKPVGADDWRLAVRRHLPGGVAAGSPAVDPGHGEPWCAPEAVATLGGVPSHVATLRTRFVASLPHQARQLAEAFRARDAVALDAELHRLTASCAFVGATHLAACVERFRSARDCPDAFDCVMRAIRMLSVEDAFGRT